MANSASAAGFAGLCAGIMALEVYCFFDPQSGAGATSATEAPLLDSALELLLPLGAAAMLCAAAAYIYRHLSHAAAPTANKRRPLRVVVFVLCVCTGVLDYLLFVRQASGGVDHGAQARALGVAAHTALPAAASATFFWGVMLIIIGHVRSGGEGGGGAGAGHGANEGTVRRVVNNIALGAAAGLVFLVVMALCFVE